MKNGFSLGVDVIVDEDGKYDASVAYTDTDNIELEAEAKGKNIEEVCWLLYEELVAQLDELEEEPEDMSDAEYIKFLEEEVARLKKEKADNKKNSCKANNFYHVSKKSNEKNSPLKYVITW